MAMFKLDCIIQELTHRIEVGMSRVQGKALAVSSGICIAAGLAGVVIMQSLGMPRRELARVSVPEALNLVQDQQVRQPLSGSPCIDLLELLFS